jgi:hypothetical protein
MLLAQEKKKKPNNNTFGVLHSIDSVHGAFQYRVSLGRKEGAAIVNRRVGLIEREKKEGNRKRVSFLADGTIAVSA